MPQKKQTKRPNMPVTLEQLARRVGVSTQTVSAILGAKAHLYRVETRERVLSAAKEMGYRPNALARATRTGRSGTVALLIASNPSFSHLPPELLHGVESELSDRDLQLAIAQLPDEKLVDQAYVPRILREWAADGILINYHHHIPPAMVDLVRKHELPSIWINSRQRGDCVYPDEAGAAIDATADLIRRGHKRIAYVDYAHGHADYAQAHYSVQDRRSGFLRAMEDAGLEPVSIEFPEKLPLDQRLPHAQRMLAQRRRPTAFVAYSTTSGSPLYIAALLAGLQYEQDLTITTFNDEPVRLANVQRCRTMIVPNAEMGRQAVRLLVEKIERPGQVLEPRVVRFDMVVPEAPATPTP